MAVRLSGAGSLAGPAVGKDWEAHLHERALQRAFKTAARNAGIVKPATNAGVRAQGRPGHHHTDGLPRHQGRERHQVAEQRGQQDQQRRRQGKTQNRRQRSRRQPACRAAAFAPSQATDRGEHSARGRHFRLPGQQQRRGQQRHGHYGHMDRARTEQAQRARARPRRRRAREQGTAPARASSQAPGATTVIFNSRAASKWNWIVLADNLTAPMDYTALAKHRVNRNFNQVKGRKMKPALALSTVLLLAAASPMVAENDGSVCELPGTQCRALETAVVGPRLNGQTVDQGFASFPSVYFDNGTMYMSAHAFFLANWRPPGVTLCSTVLGDQIETGALWMKAAVSASNITQPFSFVRRISPCRNEINGEIDPLRGAENGGGGNGTEIEKGFNGLYYTLASTFFEKHPYKMNQVCDDWNQGCFPGIYIGAQTSPTAMPTYMLARLLSIYDFGGASRGFQGIRLAPFNDPSRPAPSAAAFPRQSFNGTPALFFGYVTWGTIIPESCPCSTARIQIVDVPDGVVRPSWASTRIFMVDNTGVWRLVPTGGRPDFVPETLVDTTGFNEFANAPSPFYDSGQGGWRNAMHWNYLPSGTTGCNEVSRSGFEGGNSTVAHRAVDGSGSPVIFDVSTSTTNGFQLGVEIFQIPGAGPQWYLARGSTERICFGNQAWWHPFLGSEITIEKVSPPIAVVSGTYGANCGAALGNKTAHLATSCNGQESCPYAVNWQTLGDPAPGCAKDYAARWTCGGAGPTFLYTLPPEAGLGSIANLTCQAPVITVVAGSYGTNCNPAAAGNRTAALVAACSGRTSCNYTVNHQILGDPYPGCAKNYRAEWKCGASATVLSHVLPPEAGFGSVANLVCN